MYTEHCTVYTVQCSLYRTLYTVRFSYTYLVYSVYLTPIHCPKMYIVHFTLCSIHCTLYTVVTAALQITHVILRNSNSTNKP